MVLITCKEDHVIPYERQVFIMTDLLDISNQTKDNEDFNWYFVLNCSSFIHVLYIFVLSSSLQKTLATKLHVVRTHTALKESVSVTKDTMETHRRNVYVSSAQEEKCKWEIYLVTTKETKKGNNDTRDKHHTT